MKESKRWSIAVLSKAKACNNFFICSALLLLLLVFSGFAFSTTRLFFQGFCSRQDNSEAVTIEETVIFPDEALVFLKYPSSRGLFTKADLHCIYFSPDSSSTSPSRSTPKSVNDEHLGRQIVRCQPPPRGSLVSLAGDYPLPAGPTYRWNSLAYEALIDSDNTTVVFVKGFNLRGGKVANATKFRCVYGWDFQDKKTTNFMLQSDVVSVAQEIVRCRTPSSIINGPHGLGREPIKVSVRLVGRSPVDSVARPKVRLEPSPVNKEHELCVCTMLMNQARFLREWIMYHAEIGVQRWFIYDNNSDDDINDVLESLGPYNVTRHVWPWIKTQEAGLSHCALRARGSCKWVGFIDVDEFYLPSGTKVQDVLRRQDNKTGELRVPCHSFGPSGLKQVPTEGVTVGYTCRLVHPERHKSIVRPEALDHTLMNVVHHFRLSRGYKWVDIDKSVMVLNHYKYQVWEVFKEKFHRRVATYVSDWKQDQNTGSKDRAPGLGTRAVEPPDWHTRFCEVRDTGLKKWVLQTFTDPDTGRLPWQ